MLEPHRPMLWITEIPWDEIRDQHPDLRLTCEDPDARRAESALRIRRFTQRHLHVDEVEDGVVWVPMRFTGADYGIRVEEDLIAQGHSSIQSHGFKPVITEMEHVEKIRMPEVAYDRESTEREKDRLDGWFGDLLPVRIHGPRQHFFNGWDELVRWTGVQNALLDLMERPDFIHALLRRMTDSFLERMRQFEAGGWLGAPHPLLRAGSGAAGFTDELPRADTPPDGPFTALDQWGGAAPQIFSDVSPAMHEEFALRYEIEVLSRCGLNYYGCCEPLHTKMHLMDTVPRLRKISISPWCDAARANAAATRKYVFSHKPNPALLATDPYDPEAAEADLRRRLDGSDGMASEVIMKDISTVREDLGRLLDWTRMAARVVREYGP